ncbi:MAG: hypothetical protein RIF41_31475 [Polyangiaceae bacterium]
MGENEATKLGTDVFIALAAVGWADGELHRDEADAIVRCALEEELPLEAIAAVEEATMAPVDVGTIDLSKLSKADRLFVYAVGAWITRVDGNVAPEEKKALDDLGRALRIPEAPRAHARQIAEDIGAIGDSTAPAFYNLPMLRKTLKVRLAEAQKLRAAREDG